MAERKIANFSSELCDKSDDTLYFIDIYTSGILNLDVTLHIMNMNHLSYYVLLLCSGSETVLYHTVITVELYCTSCIQWSLGTLALHCFPMQAPGPK